MSKKSTARTGSEGDAESTVNDVFANIRSEASSCKSKREFEGGPFGDSPCAKNQQFLKDYFILMFQDDDDTTEASEASEVSDVDQELYDLQNDYLEKLNSVRRTFNLLELSDDLESLSPNSCDNRCTITEIVDEEADSNRSNKSCGSRCMITEIVDEEVGRAFRKQEIKSVICAETEVIDKSNGNKKPCTNSDKYDVIKIYPSTETFNFESTSTQSILELEYNPPKKKVCHRQKTPKLMSISDGNLPYYTRIGLHDDLFSSNKYFVGNNDLPWEGGSKLNRSRKTQCTEEDFKDCKAKPKARHFLLRESNKNLYPEVVIDRRTQNVSEPSSSSSQTSLKPVVHTTDNKLSLNVIEEHSDDSYTTYSTTIDSPRNKDSVKKRFRRGNRVSSTEKLTLWEEIRKLHPPKYFAKADIHNYDIVTIESNEAVSSEGDTKSKKEKNDYIGQYLRYKRQMDGVRPKTVPYGPTIAYKHSEFPGSLEYACISRSSSMSNKDKKKKKKDKKKAPDEREDNNGPRNCLEKICFCCWLKGN